MWEPRRFKTLWAFTACYRDSFTFFYIVLLIFSSKQVFSFLLRWSFCTVTFTFTVTTQCENVFNLVNIYEHENEHGKKQEQQKYYNQKTDIPLSINIC
jgi:hypothetical protein